MLRLATCSAALVATASAAGPLELHVHPTRELLLPSPPAPPTPPRPPRPTHLAAGDPGGDDAASGTASAPLRSLAAARDAVRARRHQHSGGATVLLHSGTHGPLSLDPTLDSGSPSFPIRYAGAPGADAIISAGATIPKAAWKPAAGMAAGVLMADLKSLGLTDYGSLPHSGGQIDSCDQLASQKMQLFHNSKAQVLARYPNLAPNGDWMFLYAVRASLSSSPYQANRVASRLQTAGTANGFSMTSGDNATKVLGWAKEEAPFVHGYWEWDWADSIQAIVGAAQNGSSVDVELPAGHSSKQHARFFGLNLKSELDAPNEYYIEASSGTLYYYPSLPLSQWTEEPSVSVADNAVTLDGTSHVTLHGVTVAHAKDTGVSAKAVSNVVVSNCTVFGHGANGVTIDNATKSGIVDSHVYDVGACCTGAVCGCCEHSKDLSAVTHLPALPSRILLASSRNAGARGRLHRRHAGRRLHPDPRAGPELCAAEPHPPHGQLQEDLPAGPPLVRRQQHHVA